MRVFVPFRTKSRRIIWDFLRPNLRRGRVFSSSPFQEGERFLLLFRRDLLGGECFLLLFRRVRQRFSLLLHENKHSRESRGLGSPLVKAAVWVRPLCFSDERLSYYYVFELYTRRGYYYIVASLLVTKKKSC